MDIASAIELIAVGGVRRKDGKLLIDDVVCDDFPHQITVEGSTFDFSDEEEIDAETRRCLAHYFRRD